MKASFFKSKNGLESATFRIAEQALGEVIRSGSCPYSFQVLNTKPRPDKSCGDTIDKSRPSNMGFFVLFAATVGKMMDNAVDE